MKLFDATTEQYKVMRRVQSRYRISEAAQVLAYIFTIIHGYNTKVITRFRSLLGRFQFYAPPYESQDQA